MTKVAKLRRTFKTERKKLSFPKDKPISAVTMGRWTQWHMARREALRITTARCCQGDIFWHITTKRKGITILKRKVEN